MLLRKRTGFVRQDVSPVVIAVAFLLAVASGASAVSAQTTERPNVVVLLADDLGYGDVQAYNEDSQLPTPHMNRLAEQGMRFTDAHAPSSVCTPTRYGLLTGRYAWRTRLKSGVLWGYSRPLIEEDRSTVASLLQGAGYHTAVIGKWHLGLGWQTNGDVSLRTVDGKRGHDKIDFTKQLTAGPHTVGFSHSYIIPASADMEPYVFVENGRVTQQPSERAEKQEFPAFHRAGPKAPAFEFNQLLGHLTDRAVQYIERQKQRKGPFFLYFPLTAPHKPISPAERFRGKTGLGPHADFVAQVDWSVGQVLRALKRTGAAGNTLLVVTSDNGSYMRRREDADRGHVSDPTIQGYLPENHTSNGPLRGRKADIWEGGHRIPFLVRWPGVVEPASVARSAVSLTDLFATAVEVAGVERPARGGPDSAGPDSYSLLPLLRGGAVDRPAIVHHSARGMFALRKGRWKLVMGNGSGGRSTPRGDPFERPYRLFDLREDLGESDNLIEKRPGVAERLEAELNRLRQ